MKAHVYLTRNIFITLFISALFFAGCDNPISTTDISNDEKSEVLDNSFNSDFDTETDEVIPGQYIVMLNDNSLKGNRKAVGNKAEQISKGVRGKVKNVFSNSVSGFTIQLPENASQNAVEAIKRNPNVRSVEQDRRVKLRPNIVKTESRRRAVYYSTDFTTSSWGLDRVDQRELPLDGNYKYENNGSGITVYVFDTGINYNHTDFENRAKLGFDAFGEDGADCNGHGTHVAGTIGGKTWGISNGVDLVSVRVLGCDATGSISDIIAGVDWMIENNDGPAVANMSIGTGRFTMLDNSIKAAIESGITFITSAGNSNADACLYSPARVPEVITVGATTNNDSRASYSNYGNCIDVFAPGTGITSNWIDGIESVATLNGTSMAAPHVAGVAALILEKNPSQSPDRIRSSILDNSTKGVVQYSQSARNHLLYSFNYKDSSITDGDTDNTGDTTDTSGTLNVEKFDVFVTTQGAWKYYDLSWNVVSNEYLSNLNIQIFKGDDLIDETSLNLSESFTESQTQIRSKTMATVVKLTVTNDAGESKTVERNI